MMKVLAYRSLEHNDILRLSANGDFSLADVRKAFHFFFDEPIRRIGVIFDIRDGLSLLSPADVAALGQFVRDAGCRHVAFGVIAYPELVEQATQRYSKFPELAKDYVDTQVKVFTREADAYTWVNQRINQPSGPNRKDAR